MAIFSLSISNISRGRGESTLARLGYITGQAISDNYLGKTHYGNHYGKAPEVVETLLPPGAPPAWSNPEVLFNDIEIFERNRNARTGVQILIALPREWNLQTSIQALREYVQEQLCSLGYAATFTIHEGENNNPHAHILIPNRPVDSKTGDWVKVKTRQHYALDENGERIPIIDPETGKQKLGKRNERLWKRRTVESNPLDQKDVLKDLRKTWADTANRHLDETDWIDHRSLKEQGKDRIPQIHLGRAAKQLQASGQPSDRVAIADRIDQANKNITKLKAELADLE